MSKWRYKFVEVQPPLESEEEFRRLGNDEWELVTIYPQYGKTIAIFRKEMVIAPNKK